jgi:hypothetical protein
MFILDVISIAVVIIILAIVITYLVSINKQLKQRIEQEKNRFILYKESLSELKSKQMLNKKDIETLNKLARDFFKERFNISYTLSYLEISEIFKKTALDDRVHFCDRMTEILYAGEKVDSDEVKTLINILLDIIENYKYL